MWCSWETGCHRYGSVVVGADLPVPRSCSRPCTNASSFRVWRLPSGVGAGPVPALLHSQQCHCATSFAPWPTLCIHSCHRLPTCFVSQVLDVLQLSRATLRKIQQNMWCGA